MNDILGEMGPIYKLCLGNFYDVDEVAVAGLGMPLGCMKGVGILLGWTTIVCASNSPLVIPLFPKYASATERAVVSK